MAFRLVRTPERWASVGVCGSCWRCVRGSVAFLGASGAALLVFLLRGGFGGDGGAWSSASACRFSIDSVFLPFILFVSIFVKCIDDDF